MRDFSDEAGVDWTAYATRYDLLLDYNPAYQDLIRRFDTWLDAHAPNGPLRVIDVGAGTGSFATALMAQRPDAHVTLAEPDAGMRAVAAEKLKRHGDNIRIIDAGFGELAAEADYDVVLSTHAIYTSADPEAALADLHRLARPGGKGFLIDFGAPMRVWDWRIYLMTRLVIRHGLRRAIAIAKDAREIAEQNSRVARLQRSGRYWTHDQRTFTQAVERAGWTIDDSVSVYRGYSTLTTVRRLG